MDRISIDARICGGRPCIRGTRMRVGDVISLLAAGASRAEILEDYPFLADEGHAAEHSADVGLRGSPEETIWDHAKRNGAAIVTKDRDFPAIARSIRADLTTQRRL